MRVCPKCGYKDSEHWLPLWRGKPTEYSHIEEFRKEKPELYQRLLNGEKIVDDGINVYKLAGKGKVHVYRLPLYLYKMIRTFNIPTERHRPSLSEVPSQTRLLEVKKEQTK